MSTNVTTTGENPSILTVPWIVKPATKLVIIPADNTPTFNAAALVEEQRMANVRSGRDADGKYAPKEAPVTKRQAMNRLTKASQKRSAAIDRLAAMESW